jgi:hypothetical protein
LENSKEKIHRLERENENLKKGSFPEISTQYENQLDDLRRLNEKYLLVIQEF